MVKSAPQDLPRRIRRESVISRGHVGRVARVSALRACDRDGSERARLERSCRSVVIELTERISMRVRESLGVLDDKLDRRTSIRQAAPEIDCYGSTRARSAARLTGPW